MKTTRPPGPSTIEELVLASKVRSWCASGQARRIREQARVTVGEVASAIGGNANTITKWESGSAAPDRALVVPYGRALEALRTAIGEPS